MKNNDFIITTHNEIEVCREVLSTVKNKTIFLEQLIKDTMNDINSKRGDAFKAVDDKMQASLQDALEALENNGEIKNLKQAVQLMNAKVDNFETDFKQVVLMQYGYILLFCFFLMADNSLCRYDCNTL
jgi:uncharacterized protein YbjQ (UPF0145 family)